MNDGADAVAVVIWNIVQRHELCVAGEDLVPVDLGGDALAADFCRKKQRKSKKRNFP